jgi:hypothetical protein
MRLRLFRGVPSLAIFSSQNGLADPGRCIRRLKAGKMDALTQIRKVFADSLLYVASEIMPKDTEKMRIAEIVVGAFQSLWENRESAGEPGAVKIYLHKMVLEACKKENPGLDEQAALLTIAFSEIARVMVETENALPKKYQRFYKMKFISQRPDAEIGAEMDMSLTEVEQYTKEIRAFMGSIPKWG